MAGKRGRPVGYITTPEEREKIAATQRRNWTMKRRPWMEASHMILDAIDQGNSKLAHDILDAYINTQPEELEKTG